MAGIAQASGQAAVHHGMFAIMQADAGALVYQRLHAVKVSICPIELTPLNVRQVRRLG
jgi:hypothetical protein